MKTGMQLAPGTFLWLVAHDMRLNWRRFSDMLGSASPRTVVCLVPSVAHSATGTLALVLLGGGLLLHLAAWPVVHWLSPHVYKAGPVPTPLALLILCTFTWMIAHSLFGATRTLYDRADLDLLLGSPLQPGRVFAAKASAIAASTFGSIALLTLPIANVGALVDRVAWLGVYPALIGLALIATAIGLVISIGLFFLAGPRRARVYTQLTGAFIGGVFVLGAQVAAMLPDAMQNALMDWFAQRGLAPSSDQSSLIWAPVEAARGDVGAMLALMGIGIACLAFAILSLGDRFARATLSAAGAPATTHNVRSNERIRFRTGLGRNLRRKEWRLLVRDPGIFAQLSLQIIYTVPVAVVLLRSDTLPAVVALAPTIVVVAAQIAASISWLTVSGEDAPELMASAPVLATAVDRGKLSAVALPVAVILALPLIGLALSSWYVALVTAAIATAAGTSTALLNFWHPMPGNRRGMLRRHSQSKLVALIEHALAVLWAITVVLAMLQTWIAVVPVVMVAGILAFCRARHRGTGSAGRVPVRPQAPSAQQAGATT